MTPLRRAWERHVLPGLIALAMRNPAAARERERLVPQAAGLVVEIGVGSGLNFPFYGDAVDGVIGVDPSPRLLRMARRRAGRARCAVTLLEASAERLPLADGVCDTVVSTWTLCSVTEPLRALREVRRALRPGGQLLFVEHGRAPDRRVRAWQDRITPAWSRVAGGCQLNRDFGTLVVEAGFRLRDLDTAYAPGPRIMTYFYRGRAERDDR